MLGDKGVKKPDFLKGRNAIVWSREYSTENEARCNCDMLLETLMQMNAKRMIVGHTIQDAGINAACSEQVIRCVPELAALGVVELAAWHSCTQLL
jgi:hypothetical protein